MKTARLLWFSNNLRLSFIWEIYTFFFIYRNVKSADVTFFKSWFVYDNRGRFVPPDKPFDISIMKICFRDDKHNTEFNDYTTFSILAVRKSHSNLRKIFCALLTSRSQVFTLTAVVWFVINVLICKAKVKLLFIFVKRL